MNAYESLSLQTNLVISDDIIKDAYDQTTGEEQHLSARNTLLNPPTRLKEWMVTHNIEVARHTMIPNELVTLFSSLSGLINEVSQLSKKREGATTLLAQTLLDKELFQKKPLLDELASTLQQHQIDTLAHFPKIQENHCAETANTTLQTLKFLQKWEMELNNAYTMLL